MKTPKNGKAYLSSKSADDEALSKAVYKEIGVECATVTNCRN